MIGALNRCLRQLQNRPVSILRLGVVNRRDAEQGAMTRVVAHVHQERNKRSYRAESAGFDQFEGDAPPPIRPRRKCHSTLGRVHGVPSARNGTQREIADCAWIRRLHADDLAHPDHSRMWSGGPEAREFEQFRPDPGLGRTRIVGDRGEGGSSKGFGQPPDLGSASRCAAVHGRSFQVLHGSGPKNLQLTGTKGAFPSGRAGVR